MTADKPQKPGPLDRAFSVSRPARLASPYLAEGFYETAIAQGRHRAIIGGRWEETGRLQMQLLTEAGLRPHHHLLDIGAGALRLGCKAVPFLTEGSYWATDASGALMRHGRLTELPDPQALPETHLIEDADFVFPGVPETMDFAVAFAVFTHLPSAALDAALGTMAERFPKLRALLITVFLCPDGAEADALRQPDGVVTHPDRPPYHRTASSVESAAQAAGFVTIWSDLMLPRGQRCAVFRRESAATDFRQG